MSQSQKITACAFLHHQGKMLAVQRAAHKDFLPNKWELVGGHIEFGESLEEGLKREILEELNIEVEVAEPFFAFTYLKDEETHTVEIVFLATPINPENITLNPDALQSARWLTEEEALTLYDSNDIEHTAISKGFELIKK